MLKNNKGFTVVELIVSFAFVSLLAVQLFQAVLNYRDKQDEAHIETRLIEFKNKMTLIIQKDIETKLLKDISYTDCSYRDEYNNLINNRCPKLTFMDDSYKVIQTVTKRSQEWVCFSNKPIEECATKDKQQFDVTKSYIVYGDVIYDIPDGYNIDFDNKNILQYTTVDDDLEIKHGLYKIEIGLKHRVYDVDVNIKIVTTGLAKVEGSTNTYTAYNRGDVVQAQVGHEVQQDFFVLETSGTHNSKVLLLAKNNIAKMAFNNPDTLGNSYESSAIKSYLTTVLYNSWDSLAGPQYISLPTFEQVGTLNNFCPERKYRTENCDFSHVENCKYELKGTGTGSDRAKLNEFWYTSDTLGYWTQDSYYHLTDKKHAWYVYGTKFSNGDGTVNEYDSKRYIAASNVSVQRWVRPVIELDKRYILQKY